MVKDSSVSFYLMVMEKEFNKYPSDQNEKISGLEEAIRNTEKRLSEDSDSEQAKTELNFHLSKPKEKLEKVKNGQD